MHKVKIDPNGDPLKIQITYFGGCTASYVYTLWEKDSNAKVEEKSGNNQNTQDDNYMLPLSNNKNRIIEIFSTIKNPDARDVQELVAIEVFQGDDLLHCVGKPFAKHKGQDYTIIEEEDVAAKKTALNDIFIKLT